MASSKRKHRHGIYRFYAPFYDRVFAPSFSDGHSKLYSSLVLEKNDHILEVGIGTGISLTHCPEFVRVDAIDYSEAMLVKARKRFQKGEISAQVEFTKMDAHSLEFEDNAFQHSIVAHALAVVADPKVVLEEMIRVTQRGGKIVIVNHYKKNGGPLISMFNPFRKRLGLGMHVEFIKLIEECGLDVLEEIRVNRGSTSLLVCEIPQ